MEKIDNGFTINSDEFGYHPVLQFRVEYNLMHMQILTASCCISSFDAHSAQRRHLRNRISS